MNENIDPLDTNVNEIDTSFPRLPAQLYDLKITSAKKEPTKANDGDRLTLVLENTEPAKSTTGQEIKPGEAKIYHYIGVTEKPARQDDKGKTIEAYTNAKIAKAIAAVAKAARLNTTPGSVIQNPSQLEGAVVRCKVKVQSETAEFGESNKIGEFVVVK